MEIWQAIVLGLVQGFAEFLPISSSGHLILLSNWFGIEDNVIFYSVYYIHLSPTEVAVVFRPRNKGLRHSKVIPLKS